LPVDWRDFTGRHRPAPQGRTALESSGTWLTVRGYWASDPETGAVGVAFHRLTGMCTGSKPTGPAFDVGTGDRIDEYGCPTHVTSLPTSRLDKSGNRPARAESTSRPPPPTAWSVSPTAPYPHVICTAITTPRTCCVATTAPWTVPTRAGST